MDVLYERVAGLDVHKDTVVACVRIVAEGKAKRESRTFATTTEQLEELRKWLEAGGCTHVAMEATGVYWMPVFRILGEGDFELIVANAAHIKNVPGRKTDMNDAMWIADLLACGLIRGSFVPEEEMHQLRSLTRTRKQFVREQTRQVQRIEKTLEEANIRLGSVISDIMGASGRRIINAIVEGVRQPSKLAALASQRIKVSPKELYDALHGRLTDHHRFLLALHLKEWDNLDEMIRRLDDEIARRIAGMEAKAESGKTPFRDLIKLLTTIPGVSAVAAPALLSEIGSDMSRFPSVGHLISWSGLCPGQNESAGKRKSSRLRKGAPWLKTMLVQCAWAAKRKKNSYYRAQFFRLQSKRGPQKAICAVAASLLTAIYHILRDGTDHHDLGVNYFDRRPVAVQANRLLTRLKKLGFTVQLQPAEQGA